MIEWRWKPFSQLSLNEIYTLLSARSAVFVLEQRCIYHDIDGLDLQAWHLCAYDTSKPQPELAAALRVVLPDSGGEDLRIDRVLTAVPYRRAGLATQLVERALDHVAEQWPGQPIRLHAQEHLENFFRGRFGFEPLSDTHIEDGVSYFWMRRV
jgi:ElaA protein